ncbi:unnamed protein product [Allacma fusca]|uniref:Uncharacterized protein n=1 Tax=Allacma fusca TaxID=39272 RepID=A0A8J2PAB2_9HEXA|nr:unnamed protein product [Allacma fusca]
MNSAVAVFVVAALAVANAGYLGGSAYGVAPVGLAYNSGIVHGAPLLAHSGVAHVRVGRGIVGAPVLGAGLAYSSPVAYHAPLAYSAPLAYGAHIGKSVLL